MNQRNDQSAHPDMTGDVMRRLGYERVREPQPWWKKDQTIVPAILAGVGCFVLAMVTLGIMEYLGSDEKTVVSAKTEDLGEGIGKAAALADLQEIFFRIRVSQDRVDSGGMVEIIEPGDQNQVDGVFAEPLQSIPEMKDRMIDQSIYVPAATFLEVGGYERVVALAPGRST